MIPLVIAAAWLGCTDSTDLLTTCEGGNIDACFSDGLAKANAPRPKFSDARKDFVQACMPRYTGSARPKKNHPAACYELGKLVRDAKGGPQDLPRATELFAIACRGNVQDACIDHGLIVYEPPKGSEVRAEPARAVEFFFNACNEVDVHNLPDNGEPDPNARACAALGKAYADGSGVENNRRDAPRAQTLFEKACEARYAPGCVQAGDVLSRGGKVTDATERYQTGCRLDARHGCFELAQLHERGKFKGADIKLAVDYYRKTCNIDPTRGCYEAAVLLEQGRVAPREGEIESLYNLACEYGHTQACTKRNPLR